MAELEVFREVIDGRARAVVRHAPEATTMSPIALAEIARGGARDAYLGFRTLTLGVEGHGEGLVSYRVGQYEPIVGGFKLRKLTFAERDAHLPLIALTNRCAELTELLGDAVAALRPSVPDVADAIAKEAGL